LSSDSLIKLLKVISSGYLLQQSSFVLQRKPQATGEPLNTRFFAPLRGAQNDKDDKILSAIIFGKGHKSCLASRT
jgi:hypothetical protein